MSAPPKSPLSESGLLKELTARLIGAPVVGVQSTRNYSFVMNRKGTTCCFTR